MKIARWESVWKNLSDNEIFCGFKCLNCGYKAKKIYDDIPLGRYHLTEKCPNCGAKMVKMEDSI